MLVGLGTHSGAGPGLRGWVPFWEGEDWGSSVLAPSGPTPAPGGAPSARVWAWRWGGLLLEAAERTLGRWGSERRPGAHLFRAKLVGRGQAPWSRPRVCWLCTSEQRALPTWAGSEDAWNHSCPS